MVRRRSSCTNDWIRRRRDCVGHNRFALGFIHERMKWVPKSDADFKCRRSAKRGIGQSRVAWLHDITSRPLRSVVIGVAGTNNLLSLLQSDPWCASGTGQFQLRHADRHSPYISARSACHIVKVLVCVLASKINFGSRSILKLFSCGWRHRSSARGVMQCRWMTRRGDAEMCDNSWRRSHHTMT